MRLAAACAASGRDLASITLLAVSKFHPAASVAEAHAAGLLAFGENYVQEGLDKRAELAGLQPVPTWHLIGPLQSNKTRPVAEAFDWVHTVDRLKVAERLNAQRPPALPRLNVCLQVNVSGEDSKSGVAPADLPALAEAVMALPRLRLRGLMSIPAPVPDPERQRVPHRRLRELLTEIESGLGIGMDTLSMGMSDDLESAVAEGSTMVRIGTAIFGSRPAIR